MRYCDDFLILDRDPIRLAAIREKIRLFLAEKLCLLLNTRYAAITDVNNGVDFIGYIIRPDYVLVRRRSVNNLRRRLQAFEKGFIRGSRWVETTVAPTPPASGQPSGVGTTEVSGHVQESAPLILYAIGDNPRALQRLRGVLASYCGHFTWADTHRLRQSLFRRYPWLNAMFRLDSRDMPKVKKQFKKIMRYGVFS